MSRSLHSQVTQLHYAVCRLMDVVLAHINPNHPYPCHKCGGHHIGNGEPCPQCGGWIDCEGECEGKCGFYVTGDSEDFDDE